MNRPIARLALALLLSCACALLSAMAWAATPAGTIIRNQASATYIDAAGSSVTVTSNLVETRIEQVAGIELASDQQVRAVANGTVRLTHRIRNTGNGDDRYSLLVSNSGGDDINLSALNIYPDADRDGIRDSDTPILTTPWMAADADFYVVVEGLVPGVASVGDVGLLSISAASDFDSVENQTNTDTVLIDDGATLQVTKSISQTQGLSPSGPFTVRLQYQNTGVATATNVAILDALPDGMSYVAGSAMWSESAVALTDNDPLDSHAGPVSSVRYCAFDVSCAGIPEAQADADNDTSNQVTLILDNLVAGDLGTLSFQVTIDADQASGALINQAEFELDTNGSTTPRAFSNPVGFTVLPTAGVVANGSTATDIDGMNEPVNIISGAQGGVVYFDNIIWNTGNLTDTFNIELQLATSTMPAGSTYALLKGDAATPLQDTNNDGIKDTGPILSGAFAQVVLRVELPANASGNNGGVGFDISKLARSVSDSGVFNPVTDHLDEIVANQVDLSNQAPAGSPGALGSGPGPEALPVSTLSPGANQIALIDLYVRHQGIASDTYDLRVFSSALGDPLPSGWLVRFLDPVSGAVLSETGALASGASRHIVAEVTVPPTLASGSTSLFFEARSKRTGASDIKHDAITLPDNNQLNLEPSLSAQLEPGGTVVYRHTLSNIGNTSLSDIDLQLSHSLASWTGTLFTDQNQDGVLDASDPMFTGPVTLAPGEFLNVLVKVFAPANAIVQDRNVSTLVASWNGASSSAQVTDTTTVTKTHVSIRKEQAVDLGCDGAPDAGAVFAQARLSVPPGNNCVLYRLTALNTGVETSFNVKINDTTPSYTRYRVAASCSRVPCWLVEPANEGTGIISAETDQLPPGDSFSLTFSVRIE